MKTNRSSPLEMFLGKDVLKKCNNFIGEHPCRSVISIKLQSNFIEIALRHGCSPVNLLHIFRTPFYKNTSGGLLLKPNREETYAGNSDTNLLLLFLYQFQMEFIIWFNLMTEIFE